MSLANPAQNLSEPQKIQLSRKSAPFANRNTVARLTAKATIEAAIIKNEARPPTK
jgi:hypothetical protein